MQGTEPWTSEASRGQEIGESRVILSEGEASVDYMSPCLKKSLVPLEETGLNWVPGCSGYWGRNTSRGSSLATP